MYLITDLKKPGIDIEQVNNIVQMYFYKIIQFTCNCDNHAKFPQLSQCEDLILLNDEEISSLTVLFDFNSLKIVLKLISENLEIINLVLDKWDKEDNLLIECLERIILKTLEILNNTNSSPISVVLSWW